MFLRQTEGTLFFMVQEAVYERIDRAGKASECPRARRADYERAPLIFWGNHRPANHHIFGRNAEHSNYRGIDLADCF